MEYHCFKNFWFIFVGYKVNEFKLLEWYTHERTKKFQSEIYFFEKLRRWNLDSYLLVFQCSQYLIILMF